jgi:hypothetical protein
VHTPGTLCPANIFGGLSELDFFFNQRNKNSNQAGKFCKKEHLTYVHPSEESNLRSSECEAKTMNTTPHIQRIVQFKKVSAIIHSSEATIYVSFRMWKIHFNAKLSNSFSFSAIWRPSHEPHCTYRRSYLHLKGGFKWSFFTDKAFKKFTRTKISMLCCFHYFELLRDSIPRPSPPKANKKTTSKSKRLYWFMKKTVEVTSSS